MRAESLYGPCVTLQSPSDSPTLDRSLFCLNQTLHNSASLFSSLLISFSSSSMIQFYQFHFHSYMHQVPLLSIIVCFSFNTQCRLLHSLPHFVLTYRGICYPFEIDRSSLYAPAALVRHVEAFQSEYHRLYPRLVPFKVALSHLWEKHLRIGLFTFLESTPSFRFRSTPTTFILILYI